jgi:hypothetical protein
MPRRVRQSGIRRAGHRRRCLGSFVGASPAAVAMREETTRFLELALEPRSPSTADLIAALQPPGSPALAIVPPS